MRVKKRTGYFNSFDGNKTYFEVRGEGEPIIMAYGLACQFNHWIHQINYFSKNYSTIVFDYRGHHKTATPVAEENLSIAAIAKDISLLCHHLDIKKAHFFAHSLGVPILLKAYEHYPEFFKSLVFINGFVKNPIKGMFGLTEILENFFYLFKKGHGEAPHITSAVWKTILANPLAGPSLSLAGGFNFSLTALKDIEIYTRGVSLVDLDVFTVLFEDMLHFDGEEVLPQIKCPTLVISGEKDAVTPWDHQEIILKKVENSKLLKVPYGSHCTQLDFPEFVNLRIEKFFAEN